MIIPYAGFLTNRASSCSNWQDNGWLLCDGTEVSASTYAVLKVIFFKKLMVHIQMVVVELELLFLPDLRGRVIAVI